MKAKSFGIAIVPLFVLAAFGIGSAQKVPKPTVRTVSIPISIYIKGELAGDRREEIVPVDRLIVLEDKMEQQILSIRSIDEAPMALAFIIQEDLTPNFNLQIKDLKEFITRLPRGTRVMVAYSRGGTTQIAQKFTTDLTRAAAAIRPVASSIALSPRTPFDAVSEVLNRFDALPAGRRAILLVSDGLERNRRISTYAKRCTRSRNFSRTTAKCCSFHYLFADGDNRARRTAGYTQWPKLAAAAFG
ncbi:MAG: hypothetical protein C4325_05255 [Blastocatellia bacterium]